MAARQPIAKREMRTCSICGGQMRIIFYRDRSYRGGHYFGRIPLHRKSEWKKALRAGTRKVRMGTHTIDVLKKDPKPYGHVEYWECPKCYWR